MGRSQPSHLPPQEAVVQNLLRVREAKPEAAQPQAREGYLRFQDSPGSVPLPLKCFFSFSGRQKVDD